MRFRLVYLALAAAAAYSADLRRDLVFEATFDGTTDAKVAGGDKKLYSAPDFKQQASARPGLEGTDVELARGAGRHGDALRFKKKNTKAVFFKGKGNVPFDAKNWTGTVSFWLSLDPDADLEPGYCDPIQVTDKAFNDSAIWTDFTKDDKPRHFRLGVFGELKSWNPQNVPADKSPDFLKRLVVVKQPPFARGKWTHVAVVHEKLGSGKGQASLYVNGKLQGKTPVITEIFSWDPDKSAIRLGLSYVGLMDDVAIYKRALTDGEIQQLAR